MTTTTTHRRFQGPQLQHDPNHDSYAQLDTTKIDPADLPKSVDLRPHCPPIVDQGQTESCTANALAAAYGYMEGRIAGKEYPVSRLFIFYNERDIEHTTDKDTGAYISDGVKVLKKFGACSEATWPFDVKAVETKPHSGAYDEGKGHEIDQAETVAIDLHAMKHCLAEGYPFVFGLQIDDFEPDKKTGICKRPTTTKGLGGHAMTCVGYDDDKKCFLVRNSWGTSFGLAGYCWVPYDWMTDENSCDDAWTIRRAHDVDFSQNEPAADGQPGATGDDDSDDDDSDDDSDDDDSDDDSDDSDDDADDSDDDADDDSDDDDDDSDDDDSDDDTEEEAK